MVFHVASSGVSSFLNPHHRVAQIGVKTRRVSRHSERCRMPEMSDQARDELLGEVRVGVLGIDRDNKGPLLAPVWYRYSSESGFEICMADSSAKAHRLRAAGKATLCIQDESRPYRYVTAEGPAHMQVMTEGERDEILRDIAIRYLGTAAGNTYADNFPGHPEALLTLTPQNWWSEVIG